MSIRKGNKIIAGFGSGGDGDSIKNQNPVSPIEKVYDWVGTLEEYEEQDIDNTHPEWVCFVTDDIEGGDSVYTKEETDTLLNDKLSTNRITNCITHIPQDIKLELNNGTLTLKAGSKVYIPNGFEEDGTTRKFDEITTSTDLNLAVGGSEHTNAKHLVYVNSSADGSIGFIENTSGKDWTKSTGNYEVRYNVAENKIKYRSLSSPDWSTEIYSLPICIAVNTNGLCDYVAQVFDCFGCMGNTFFGLPGVSFLCPNGRNEDETLNNVEKTSSQVSIFDGYNADDLVRTVSQDLIYFIGNGTVGGWCSADSFIDYYPTPATRRWWRVYDTKLNKVFYSSDGADYKQAIEPFYLGRTSRNSSTHDCITDIYVENTFQAQDYNDTEHMGHQAMPSNKYIDLSLGASGTSYTAPADGYVWASGTSTNAASDLNVSDGVATYSQSVGSGSNQALNVQILVRKGETFTIIFYNVTLTRIRFAYAEGSK